MNFFTTPEQRTIESYCDNGTVTAKITKPASIQYHYTYTTGYQWNDTLKQWSPFTYQCDGQIIANTWCNGNAHATLDPSFPYFIAYTCSYVNNEWKCGCRDALSCNSSGLWGLQRVK